MQLDPKFLGVKLPGGISSLETSLTNVNGDPYLMEKSTKIADWGSVYHLFYINPAIFCSTKTWCLISHWKENVMQQMILAILLLASVRISLMPKWNQHNFEDIFRTLLKSEDMFSKLNLMNWKKFMLEIDCRRFVSTRKKKIKKIPYHIFSDIFLLINPLKMFQVFPVLLSTVCSET